MAYSFTQNDIRCDDLVFAIETDVKGHRDVRFYGYGYYAGNVDEKKPYRFVEYVGFCMPMDEVIACGIFMAECDGAPAQKQYIEDCAYERMMAIYQHYDNGKCPTLITEAEFTESLPDGVYIVQYPTSTNR